MPGAFVFAVPANLSPQEAAKDPLKNQMLVRHAREQGLIPCAALLERLCLPQHHKVQKACEWARLGQMGYTKGGGLTPWFWTPTTPPTNFGRRPLGGGGARAAVPWTMGLRIVPRAPAQSRQGSPPSYLRKSKTDILAHLSTPFPAGRPGLSARERQRHGPICLRVPVPNRLKVPDPPKSASKNRPTRAGVGLPGTSPPT